MKKNSFLVLALAIFFSFLTCCIIYVPDYTGTRTFSPRKQFQRSLPFEPGGKVSLDNINGDIEIRGWEENRVELSVEEIKRIPYSRKVRFYGIGYSQPKVDFEKVDEDFIKIKTGSNGEDQETSFFNCLLNVPNSIILEDIRNNKGNISISDLYGKVVVDLEEGDLKIENFSGSLRASLVTGSVQAELLDMRNEDEVWISTKEGDITLYLQPEMNAKLEASASSGEISSEFDLNEPLPAKKISVQLGEEGTSISLSSSKGNISLRKVKKTGKD